MAGSRKSSNINKASAIKGSKLSAKEQDKLLGEALKALTAGNPSESIAILSQNVQDYGSPLSPAGGQVNKALNPVQLISENKTEIADHEGEQKISSLHNSGFSSASHDQIESKDIAHNADQLFNIGDISGLLALLCPRAEDQFWEERADVSFKMGNIFLNSGKIETAQELYLNATSDNSKNPDPWNNVGLCLYRLGKYQEAIPYLEKALKLNPSYGIPLYNLGLCHYSLNSRQDAEKYYRQALACAPAYSAAYSSLALLLENTARFEESEIVHKTATLYANLDPQIFYNYGEFLLRRSRHIDAADKYQTALQYGYSPETIHFKRGLCYRVAGLFQQSIFSFKLAINIAPESHGHHIALGFTYCLMRRYAKALYHYKIAHKLNPADLTSLSNIIYSINFGRAEPISAEHKWGSKWKSTYIKQHSVNVLSRFDLPNKNPKGRKLKVGILSAEIGDHAISYFLTSVLESLDKSKFIIYIYETGGRTESRTQNILSKYENSFRVADMNDLALSDLIRSHNVDVLFDTTAHMRNCRLGVLLRRSAPVQAHMIGYHGTCGIDGVDYFIADQHIAPPENDHHFVESVYRLKRPWVCFNTSFLNELPSICCPPSQNPPVIGCFNNFEKISNDTLEIWAQIMIAVPNCKLLLKDKLATSDLAISRILDGLASEGISKDRVEIVGFVSSWEQHMLLYNRLDLALDTTPLNSGTTAFDALLMGVPVLGLVGNAMGSRLTYSILTSLGKPEWVASSSNEYVESAVRLLMSRNSIASSEERLKLRELFINSSLCDKQNMKVEFGRALEEMFGEWYAGKQVSIASLS